MRRDARAIAETARLRGVGLTTGSRLQRARAAAPLALPLVGSALERGLDAAEAMAARGYGEGRRTRLPERRRDAGERLTLAIAVLLAGVVAWALVTGATAFTFYPVLDPLVTWQSVALSAAALAALAGAAVALSRTGTAPSDLGRPYSP
jgi:energy-coupling factor transport system permease protein